MLLFLTALTACEERSNRLNLNQPTEEGCALTNETLAGTTWLYNKLAADGSGVRSPDRQTRMKFYEEGGTLKVKYTVGSYSDVYEYHCFEKAGEWACFEPPKYKDWCQALTVAEKEGDPAACTPEALAKIAQGLANDEEIAAGIKEAGEVIAKYKGGEQWEQFVFNNNNLGNKLQGRLYAQVNDKKCLLRVTDNYMTIYNGAVKEDSNPVGTDQFVQTDETGLMWEHCTDASDLIAMKTDKFPESEAEVQPCVPNQGCSFASGETVHYHYIGIDGRETKKGCTYSYDTYVDWAAVDSGKEAAIVDFKRKKEARYGFSASHTEVGAHVVELVRYATCDGKKELAEVACNLVLVQ
ncbi:MAG TPA: hypothetical protein QGF58_24215 [Myxococcota bacterium]|nr:hypothetical protein [Myxococcota bacterium]